MSVDKAWHQRGTGTVQGALAFDRKLLPARCNMQNTVALKFNFTGIKTAACAIENLHIRNNRIQRTYPLLSINQNRICPN